MTADQPMTAEQAATLKRLAEAAYELEAFQPNPTRAEADLTRRSGGRRAAAKLLTKDEARRIAVKIAKRAAA